jgi:hypothetical protein
MLLANYDFTKGWKPYEGGKLPSTSDIPKSIQRTMTSTVVDGKEVHLAGSLETAQYLEEHGAIPLGWRAYEGIEIVSEIPKELLDSGMFQIKMRGDKAILWVAPGAFWFMDNVVK